MGKVGGSQHTATLFVKETYAALSKKELNFFKSPVSLYQPGKTVFS